MFISWTFSYFCKIMQLPLLKKCFRFNILVNLFRTNMTMITWYMIWYMIQYMIWYIIYDTTHYWTAWNDILKHLSIDVVHIIFFFFYRISSFNVIYFYWNTILVWYHLLLNRVIWYIETSLYWCCSHYFLFLLLELLP